MPQKSPLTITHLPLKQLRPMQENPNEQDDETFNLLVNYDRKHSGVDWEFFFRVDNVFDENYYNVARGYTDSNEDGTYDAEDLSIVVNQGRTFTAGLSARF